MKKNWKVKTSTFVQDFKIIIVYNYTSMNLISNLPAYDVNSLDNSCSIGYWKLKK